MRGRVKSWGVRAVGRPARGAIAGALAVVLFAAGCAVGPDYTVPEPDLPDAWHLSLSRGLETGDADLRTWWTQFRDPILDSLIDRATVGSLDLRLAFARVMEARARRGVAPYTVDQELASFHVLGGPSG